MKKMIVVLLLMMSALGAGGAVSADDAYEHIFVQKSDDLQYYSSVNLNIRSTPEGKVVGQYRKGEKVKVEGYEKDWAKTDKGYVYTPYLTTDPAGIPVLDIKERSVGYGLSYEKKKELFAPELADADYSHVSDSLFISIQKHTLGTGKYFLTHILVKNPDQIHGAVSNDSFGGIRELPTSVAERTGSPLVVNGSYFSYETGKPSRSPVYILEGEVLRSEGTTTGYEVYISEDGTLFSPEKGMTEAELQEIGIRATYGTAGPILIQNGEDHDLTYSGKNWSYPRTAVGMVEAGEYYIITAGNGNYTEGLELYELQKIFRTLGCIYAVCLDEGGSSALVFEGTLLNNPAAGEQRPVVDFLYFMDDAEEENR